MRLTLGEQATPLCSPQAFQDHVAASRREISAWIDDNLIGSDGNSVLLTPLTRSPFSPLFSELVWLRVIDNFLIHQPNNLLVITGSIGLTRALENHCQAKGICCYRVGYPHLFATIAKRRVRSLLKFCRDLVHAGVKAVLARQLLGKAQIRRVLDADILVDTYLYPSDVKADGAVIHRYYPGLIDWYLARGHKPAYLPTLFRVPLRQLPALYRGYRSSQYLFVPMELFLGFSDIVWGVTKVATRALTGSKLPRPFIFGLDMSAIVEAESWGAGIEGLPQMLTKRATKSMVEAGMHPKWVLDWFENQSIDQALAIGFREALPDCRLIAMRLYAQYSSNLLSFQVTNREREQGLVPDEHWMGGEAWLDVATRLDSHGGYKVVPNLRSSYLYKQQVMLGEGDDLLVLLTHSLQDTVQVLVLVGTLLPVLEKLFPVIRIKPHPSLGRDQLKKVMSDDEYRDLFLSRAISWEESGISTLMAKARLVVSAGTSSAIEAVAMGNPVVLVGAQVGIDMCPLEFVDKTMWRIAYDANQLKEAILAWSPDHPLSRVERMEIGRTILKKCYAPVSEAEMEKFSLE